MARKSSAPPAYPLSPLFPIPRPPAGATGPAPLPPADPAFRDCYRAVGDFPEVNLGLKTIMTRIFTAFGAGFAPVL